MCHIGILFTLQWKLPEK